MRVAFVLPDDRDDAALAEVDSLARALRAGGHEVDVVLALDEPPPFDGHTRHPDGVLTLAQALRTGARDVCIATTPATAAVAAGLGPTMHIASAGSPPPAVASAATAWPSVFDTVARRGVRLLRRALASRRARPPARPRPIDPSLRPGEPVLFAGQPSYFRSAWYDAVADGWGREHAVSLHEPAPFASLLACAREEGAKTCVVFQPELLPRATFDALARQGVRIVAFASEPVPLPGITLHWDQARRLEALRPARCLPWDLFVCFDPAARDTLAGQGFGTVHAHPLPVSERIFRPAALAPDFDVCFLGWSTPHREAFLAPLRTRYRVLHVAHGAFDHEAAALMNRSRLVLNLHAHAYPSFENRAVQALFCGRPLISEPLSNDLLRPFDDFVPAHTPAELAEIVHELLDGGVTPPRPSFDRTRFLASSLRDLLSETR